MNIETVRTNFTQFSDGLLIRVENSGASLVLDVDQRELRDFARRLIDVADDCLRAIRDKSEADEQAMSLMSEAIDAVSST